jgi:Protein of unknown function (DUF2911)
MTSAKKAPSVLLWVVLILIFMLLVALSPPALTQHTQEEPGSATAICTFEDGKQVSLRYMRPSTSRRDGLRLGKLWIPGGSPPFLFTESDLRFGNSDIPTGAYSIYLIPGNEAWTLIVNRNVTSGVSYDERQDLLRARMQLGELNEPAEELTIYFGHVGPRECDMRFDYGKTRAWIEFKEK